MRCVILQPSYIPWRGYFHLIHLADTFVFFDDVQYDARGWRNRNRIKSPSGSTWLTIPVRKHGAQTQAIQIRHIDTVDEGWATGHLGALQRSYSKAPHFAAYRQLLERLYADPPRRLAEFTIASTVEIASSLGIRGTEFVRSSEIPASGRKTDRLITILRELGADSYVSGPSARSYIEAEKFDAAGIALEWMTYDYPEYDQLYPPFDPFVSILDLLFMTGPDAPRYIWDTAPDRGTQSALSRPED